jgi:hypothetical protein
VDWPILVPAAQVTAAGALLAIVYLLTRAISRGDWVPRRELDYLRQDRDARLVEKDQQIAGWRAAHETSERTRELQAGQNRDLLDALRAQERFFDAFRDVVEREPADGS